MAEDIDDEIVQKSGALGTETTPEGEDSDGEVLPGTEQDDEASTGEEDEGADAGEGSEAEGDDDQQEEVAAPKEKAPALKAAPAVKVAPAQKAAPSPEPLEDDDPDIKPLVERRGQIDNYLKNVTSDEARHRAFLNGETKLTDGRTFDDLPRGDQNFWTQKHLGLLADKTNAERALSAHEGTLSAKRAEVGENRAFVRSVGKLMGTMDGVVAGVGDLSEEQEDAVRGFLLRKANSPEGNAFFNLSKAQITAEIKARLGAAPKSRNSVVKGAPKKAPPSVVGVRTSGGAPGAESKAVKGLSAAEEATLQRINPQMLNLLKKGQVPVASVKAVLADHLPKGGKK